MLRTALLAWLLAAGSLRAEGDHALARPVTGTGVSGNPSAVTRGVSRPEGEPGGAAHAAILKGAESVLTIDLGETREIKALVLQADSDDVYMVERSTDGSAWSGLLKIEAGLPKAGLRTHHAVFPSAMPTRYLAIHAEGGDGRFFVSRLSVYSKLPTPWPPVLAPLAPTSAPAGAPAATQPAAGAPQPAPAAFPAVPLRRPPEGLTEPKMAAIKGLLAAAGCALLAWGAALKRRGRAAAHRSLRDALLAALGIVSLASWWNLGHFHFESYTHLWDTFHYYLGAKYAPELRYDGLYECAVAATVASGRLDPGATVVARDLKANHLGPLSARDAVNRCAPRFGSERWSSFVSDVAWFRERTPDAKWQEILSDHGYNGTPAWAVLGRLLSGAGPVSSDRIALLTALDSLLLLAMWGAVAWAFGWRAACVALLFWGTNYPGRYWWNGGAFLRMDWLFCLVVGICLLRKERPRVAGVLLALAALLRIFPGVVLAALAAVAIARWVREQRVSITSEERGLAIGAAAATAIVLALSLFAAGPGWSPRWSVWREFAANSRKHVGTPLTNEMGLKTVLTYRPATRAERLAGGNDTDPFARWKAVHVATAARMAPLLALLSAAALVGFAAAFRGRSLWLAAAAGVGLIPVFTGLTCYYYSALAVLGLLWLVREEIGAIWAGVACATCAVAGLLRWDDDRYTLMSALVLAAVAATWLLARGAPDAQNLAEAGTRAERRRRQRER